MNFNQSFFSFIVYILHFPPNKLFPMPSFCRYFSMFSSICFEVLPFIFRPIFHLELIFVCDVRCSKINFSRLDTQLNQHYLFTERIIFSPLYCIVIFVINKVTSHVRFIPKVYSVLFVYFLCQYHRVLIILLYNAPQYTVT